MKLAIVGRPNVGKSRLFNRLAGRTAAIVHDTPGVTRDRQAVDADYEGLALRLIDTAGFEDAATGSIANRMTKQTLTAIAEAEALLFLIDARAGVTAGDQIIAQALRKAGQAGDPGRQQMRRPGRTAGRGLWPGLWRGDCDFRRTQSGHGRYCRGAGSSCPGGRRGRRQETEEDEEEFTEDDEPEEDVVVNYLDRPLRLALVGRPNVGKSSLFNQLLGEERSLTGPEAGLTRDAITAPWKAGGARRAAARHRGPAQEGAGGGRDAGGNVGGLHPGSHPLSPIA